MTTEITARDKLLLYVVGMFAFIFFFVQFMLMPALSASDQAAADLADAQQAHAAPDQTQGGFADGQRLRPAFTRQSRFSRRAADHGHARRAWRGACGRKKG